MVTTFRVVSVQDAAKVPEAEWDNTSPAMRDPYVELHREGGFVYAVCPEHEHHNRYVETTDG